MEKEILKALLIEALRNEYGFVPMSQDIEIVSDNGDGTYMQFVVNGIKYTFSSHLVKENDIQRPWTGIGTITKMTVRPSVCAYGERGIE